MVGWIGMQHTNAAYHGQATNTTIAYPEHVTENQHTNIAYQGQTNENEHNNVAYQDQATQNQQYANPQVQQQVPVQQYLSQQPTNAYQPTAEPSNHFSDQGQAAFQPQVQSELSNSGQEQLNASAQNSDQDTTAEKTESSPAVPDNWRSGDWKCNKCGDHNFASRSYCRQCNAEKEGGKGSKPDNWRPGDWKCKFCGDHQFASRMYCRQCDAPKNARPRKDPNARKLYCGNLTPETREDSLLDSMTKFGEISDCYILGPKGNSKGFGFVVYKTDDGMNGALGGRVELDGNVLKIEKSVSRNAGGWDWGPPQREQRSQQQQQQGDPKLYIGKLSEDTTTDQLKEYLSQFGELSDIVIMSGKGFGFATFKDKVGTEAALFAKMELNGASLTVERARPKRSRDDYYSRPPFYDPWGYDGYYGGGGGRGGGGGWGWGPPQGPPPPHWNRGPPRGWGGPRW